MADEPDEPKIYDDVPRSALAVTQDSSRALARKMAGEELPNECRFSCIMCGWDKTLQFEEDEIAAMAGDIASYSGPCPSCNSMTLVPYARLMGDDVGTVYANAKKQRLEEFNEQADVFVDRVKGEIASVMGATVPGTIFDGPDQNPSAADIHDPRARGTSPQYPDAADVSDDGLKPRE